MTEIGKEMLKKQDDLATQYKYKELPPIISMWQRDEYENNLPKDFKDKKQGNIYSENGTLIATGYERIVIGDYGAFIEISNEQIVKENLKIKEGQEYRIKEERYAKNIKYHWYTTKDKTNCKLYYQQKEVTYADYKPNYWYISPYEVILKEKE